MDVLSALDVAQQCTYREFFTDLRDTHVSGVGVKETSYYPLSNLLNFIGMDY
jgi:hypothetical protein